LVRSGFFAGAVGLSVERESRIALPSRPALLRDLPERRVVPTCGPAAGLAVNPGNPARGSLRFFRIFMEHFLSSGVAELRMDAGDRSKVRSGGPNAATVAIGDS